MIKMSNAIILPSNFIHKQSFSAYNSEKFGPLFAVSDEGSAGLSIVNAAYRSAKAHALSPIDLLSLGVVLDGERMTSAGEVPIGPDEYHALSSFAGHILCTTNVGVKVNTRLLQSLPEFEITGKTLSDHQWFENVFACFSPFLKTPDNRPRPLTVRLLIKPDGPLEILKELVAQLDAGRQKGMLGAPDVHRFSILVAFENEISTDGQIQAIERVIHAASVAGLNEVAVDGELLESARQRLGVQSLLNVLQIHHLRQLLKSSQNQGIRLTYRYQLDVESIARTIWTGLQTARTNGFAAGKYGLVPLTLEEQATVVELITRWTSSWTAIPAFYVDTPLVTSSDVYDDSMCEEAAMLWLKMARGAGATIVLFDSPDRVKPRRLLRQEISNDVGVLTIEGIERICKYSRELGVSILWSGGITSRQAYELSKRKVFGIFSTSSTASKIAVTAQFERDPRLAAENEPTEFGVRRIHAIVQGGFLSAVLDNADLAKSIDELTKHLVESENDATQANKVLNSLDIELARGWSLHLNRESPSNRGSMNPIVTDRIPVPADSVRVFRGRRLSLLSHEDFVNKLAMVFMPLTVQMQRLYGLTSYLPAVLPEAVDWGGAKRICSGLLQD